MASPWWSGFPLASAAGRALGRTLLPLAFVASGCANLPFEPREEVTWGAGGAGDTFHYVRSNRNDTEAEDVWVHRVTGNRLEVYKARERCTSAALVTAELDLQAGYPLTVTSGRLEPSGEQFPALRLTFSPDELSLVVRAIGEEEAIDSIPVEHLPWHLYDFDFADLSMLLPRRIEPGEPFSFGLALMWPAQFPDMLRYLGEVNAEFVTEERPARRPALRYRLSGSALGNGGGTLWLDKQQGHLVEASLGTPNHSGYDNFKLRLVGRSRMSTAEWRALLQRHFDGC